MNMEEFDFTQDEIREQLEKLGYHNVPNTRLQEFKRDLEQLVKAERSGSNSWTTLVETSSIDDSGTCSPKDESGNRQTDGGSPGDKSPVTHDGGPRHQSPERGFSSAALLPNDSATDTSILNSTSGERRLIKRRVLRHKDGHKEVTDELTESEMGDESSLEERLLQMKFANEPAQRPLRHNYQRHLQGGGPHSYSEYQARPRSACSSVPSYRLPEDYDGLKALIKPMSGHPNTHRVRKTDPVSQFQKYSRNWKEQSAPGEKNHQNLRWNVREQMQYHDEVVEKKSHKVFVSNNYVIPSDKKRKGLRWQIRQDMAEGVVPPTMFD